MIDWWMQRREQKRVMRVINRHYKQTQGNELHRLVAAMVLCELERHAVRTECKRRPKDERLIFLIAYECFILWIIKTSFESVVSPTRIQKLIDATKNYIEEHGHYEPEIFERLWNSILLHMPFAMIPGEDGTTFPVAELMLSVNFAGYPINQNCSPEFAIHVMATIPYMLENLEDYIKNREIIDGSLEGM